MAAEYNAGEEVSNWNGQSIRDTLALIDATHIGAIVFVDNERRVLGFVSDGDVRRALINGAELSEPISKYWTVRPYSLSMRTSISERYRSMKQRDMRHLLILDSDGRFSQLQTFSEVETQYEINPQRCPVVLMAGGRGERLRPLTDDCPKPMLEVGGVPLLEHTIRKLAAQGFEALFISVNYLSEKIIEHFQDGSAFGVQIDYLHETEPSGTGGCLKLLPEIVSPNFILMNGDLLTDFDFRGLISFHSTQKYSATMVVREFSTRLDYGVVRFDGTRFIRVEEKPTQKFYINAGIYAFRADALSLLPSSDRFDMPEFFNALTAAERQCGVLSHTGSWIDIGTPVQLEAARQGWPNMF